MIAFSCSECCAAFQDNGNGANRIWVSVLVGTTSLRNVNYLGNWVLKGDLFSGPFPNLQERNSNLGRRADRAHLSFLPLLSCFLILSSLGTYHSLLLKSANKTPRAVHRIIQCALHMLVIMRMATFRCWPKLSGALVIGIAEPACRWSDDFVKPFGKEKMQKGASKVDEITIGKWSML